jgi:uncharacterized membrane protein YfcA
LHDAVNPAWLAAVFFLISLLYASVGHGGASGYLAVLVLAGFARPSIAPMVLALNIIVTVLGWTQFQRAGYFSLRLLLPFIVTSIPAAFIGGHVLLPARLFSALLAFALLCAALRMLLVLRPLRPVRPLSPTFLWGIGPVIGLILGYLAGLTGIGGGIFLSPVLLILGWADNKQTAATSAAFIVVNSLSGLPAHLLRGGGDWHLFFPLAISVLLGGGLGAWSGAFRIPPLTLQRILGVVLLLASGKLIVDLF